MVVTHRELVQAGLKRDDRGADLAVFCAGIVDELEAVEDYRRVPSRIDLKLIDAVGRYVEIAVKCRGEWFFEIGRFFKLIELNRPRFALDSRALTRQSFVWRE